MKAVIAVGGEEASWEPGVGFTRRTMSRTGAASELTLEGGVGGFGHIGGAVHPIGNRRPGIFGYRLDEIVQAFVLADGDGEADIHPAADGRYTGVGIEAAVSPHGGVAPWPPAWRTRPTGSRRKWAAPQAEHGPGPRVADSISTSPVPAATASSG